MNNNIELKYLDAIKLLEKAVLLLDNNSNSSAKIEKIIEWTEDADDAIDEFYQSYYTE